MDILVLASEIRNRKNLKHGLDCKDHPDFTANVGGNMGTEVVIWPQRFRSLIAGRWLIEGAATNLKMRRTARQLSFVGSDKCAVGYLDSAQFPAAHGRWSAHKYPICDHKCRVVEIGAGTACIESLGRRQRILQKSCSFPRQYGRNAGKYCLKTIV